MSNLYEASKQWQNRPADERFWTVMEAKDQCETWYNQAVESTISTDTLKVAEIDYDGTRDIAVIGPKGLPARFTHYAFGQLSARLGAPSDYLRKLPPELICNNLNHGLNNKRDRLNLLIHRNGGLMLRALTSNQYARIWDYDILTQLQHLIDIDPSWRVPPARPVTKDTTNTRVATEEDCLKVRGNFSIKPGDLIAPAGVYCSDHDMFCLMINEDKRIADGTDAGLSRGFMVSNSEVGAASLKVTYFLYRMVCGNHIIWNASDVKEIKIIHKGLANRKFYQEFRAKLTEYANESTYNDNLKIDRCKNYLLGTNKQTVLDLLFGRKFLSKSEAESAYDCAVIESDQSNNSFSPNSAWGIAQGITHYSQTKPYMDQRTALDRTAGKIMQMAF